MLIVLLAARQPASHPTHLCNEGKDEECKVHQQTRVCV